MRSSITAELKNRNLTDEQYVYLIKVEAMLRKFMPNIKNINVKLAKYFPDRDLDTLRAIRKARSYKNRYDAIVRSEEDNVS